MTDTELALVKELLINMEKKCKEASKKAKQAKEDYRNAIKSASFDSDEGLIQAACLDSEYAQTRLNTLVECKIDIEILYKKLKNGKSV